MSAFALLCMILVAGAGEPEGMPPNTPAAVEGIVYARPFTLEEGYRFAWRKEHPTVSEGYVVVLQVDPALVHPRNSLEPVLYVGDRTAERVNLGHKSGRLIALVPGRMDLATAPVWFGTPELPERVDAATIAKERARAKKAGIEAFGKEAITAALRRGGERLEAADHDALMRELAGLVREYSPEEKELAESLAMIGRR